MSSSLPPESYTARRLEHATPEHLHLTSRRTFIGPIPEGWLKSHRKQWYRHYISNSASRAPTFTAATPLPSGDVPSVQAPSVQPIEEREGSIPRTSSQSAVLSQTATSQTSLLESSGREAAEPEESAPSAVSTQPRQSDRSRINKVIAKTGTVKVRFNDATKIQLRARAQRLAAKGNFRNNQVKDGEMLKMDRMLVRIDITQQAIGADFDEKVSLGVETRSLDKWREFMVVCRKHTEDDAQSVLQLYQTRVIATNATEESKTKKKPKAQILLSPRRAWVNLYSSLDKTLCVWTLEGSRTTIYYLRPQSGATSVEWYTFLQSALGSKRANTLQVNVPDLNVSLRLDNPFSTIEHERTLANAAEGDDEALAQAVNDEKGAAGMIVSRCLGMLKESPEWNDVLNSWAQYGRIGLAWKRYDRLEWVHGAVEQRMYGTIAMAKTHDLELRPKHHYPVSANSRKGATLEEPSPIEGFLIRLTSETGQEQKRLGKTVFKRLYFASQNQYLVFLRPARARPPPPPKMDVRNGNIPSSAQLAQQTSLTYQVNPYPLSGKDIAWLNADEGMTAEEREARDNEAEAETRRNYDMLLGCDGFINLCEVQRVRKMHKGAVPGDQNIDEGSDVDFDYEAPLPESSGRIHDGSTSEVDEDRIFELVMKNGIIVRLQAYNKSARHEWIRSLRRLVKYWTSRAKGDMDMLKSVREQNLEALQIDERAEAMVGSFAYKWEVSQSYASPAMYNMCGISQCRPIHLSGLLFRKPRRHTTFTRCPVILSDGHLLVFQDTLRSRSGRKKNQVQHERVAAISLAGCYLYSGLLTENDLLYQNRTFDSDMPGHHALPRVYLEDGWTSTDEDAMTTFVIWHAQSKSWFRSSHYVDDVRKKEDSDARELKVGGRKTTKLKRVSQLGVTGRSVVFKARSRAERDHWVMAIQVEIERLAAAEEKAGGWEDVRLVE